MLDSGVVGMALLGLFPGEGGESFAKEREVLGLLERSTFVAG